MGRPAHDLRLKMVCGKGQENCVYIRMKLGQTRAAAAAAQVLSLCKIQEMCLLVWYISAVFCFCFCCCPFNGPSTSTVTTSQAQEDDLFLSPFPVNESGAALSFHRQNKEETNNSRSFHLSLCLSSVSLVVYPVGEQFYIFLRTSLSLSLSQSLCMTTRNKFSTQREEEVSGSHIRYRRDDGNMCRKMCADQKKRRKYQPNDTLS